MSIRLDLVTKTRQMHVTRGFKKLGTEISFTPLLSFTLANFAFTRLRSIGLDYAVYRKPTHTDRYLNFRSGHPSQHKQAVILALQCRAKRSTSHETNCQEQTKRIFNNPSITMAIRPH